MTKYTPIIGLETHIELSTNTKMFCRCPSDYFDALPNTHVCPVCLGLPGAMPVANKKAIEWTIMLGMALNCTITAHSFFERKHYFYPDLPKGYQISQYQSPLCENGSLTLLDSNITVPIRRIHLEEDTGKLLHANSENTSLIDFNRSGVPLVEVVTEPVIQDAQTAALYLQTLQKYVQYLGISDADMEKGSMRCEPNISLKSQHDTGLPHYKVEVKNINSFKFVRKAIDFELKRQENMLQKGSMPTQETRRYIESNGSTVAMRQKEEAHDYRYMIEPDIPALNLDKKMLSNLKKQVETLDVPSKRLEKFIDMHIKKEDALLLVDDKKLGDFLLETVNLCTAEEKQTDFIQRLANYLINKKIPQSTSAAQFYAAAKNLSKPVQTNYDLLKNYIDEAVEKNKTTVSDYKSGNGNAINSLVGFVMKRANGAFHAKVVLEKLKEALS